MSQYLSGNYYCLTDKGKVRKINEDYANALINPFGNVLMVVADGMGGAQKGEVASKNLVNHIAHEFLSLEKEFKNEKAMSKWVYKVVKEANSKIYLKASSDEKFKGMGTTLSLVLLVKDKLLTVVKEANSKIYLKANSDEKFKGMGTTLSLVLLVKDKLLTAQIGDSRVYLLVDNNLTQITEDQTYVNYLIKSKGMPKEIANTHPKRHELTNALGTKSRLNVDISIRNYHNERILICSDGLYNNVPESDLASIIRGNDSLYKKANQLIAFGNFNGGSDNMALILWESEN